MVAYSTLIPIFVVTGFLGSGKTTLLNHMLRHPSLKDAAVLINEFGAVGLDHFLVKPVDENTVLLASGCLCCTIRDDLKSAILELNGKRERGHHHKHAVGDGPANDGRDHGARPVSRISSIT